ncbi:MAG TPA: BrnT family toxin [Xanthobacteraceae bacterium]|nr:BrnT family toxin [Xanthobacteraceae bacterium]
MDFEWDERTRARIIGDRALDLASAYLFFDGRPAIHQPTSRHGEERWKTTSKIDGVPFTVVWTWRGESIRVISMRRAHEQEIRKYRKAHGG